MIDDIAFDTDAGILYLVAKQVKFSFIKTLQKSAAQGGFESTSKFYKQSYCTAGVRAPFVTQDNHTFFIMRTRNPKVYSTAAGLLEPPISLEIQRTIANEFKTSRILNPKNNLPGYVAHDEVLQEFLGDPQFSKESLPIQLLHSRVTIQSFGITAIAIRRAANSPRFELEFIHPFYLPFCDYKTMHSIITKNKAKDAYEHTTEFIDIPLSADEREEAKHILVQSTNEPGQYVQDPILATTSILSNPNFGFFPLRLPRKKTTEFVAISCFTPSTPKKLNIKNISFFNTSPPSLSSSSTLAFSSSTSFSESKNQIQSTDQPSQKREKIRSMLDMNQKKPEYVSFEFKSGNHFISGGFTTNNFKCELIHFLVKIRNNEDLIRLYDHLWRNYQFLHLTQDYSRYETFHNGKTFKVRHTWAQIERAIAITIATNLLLDNLKFSESLQKEKFEKFCLLHPFIKKTRKRFGFFKPRASETYKIISSNEDQQTKLQLLNTKKETILAAVKM